MTARRANMVMAVLFLIVGILAVGNTIQLNNYIRETLPRDVAQEQCQADTLGVLSNWVQERNIRDAAITAKDEAGVAVMNDVIEGRPLDPVKIAIWRDKVKEDRKAREGSAKLAEQLPLPDC